MTGIGYAGAFLGGVFALVSPCGGLLLPAFFAYAFGGRTALLVRTLVFYAGLAAVLVPLGVASSQASRLIFGHQEALALTAGLLLVAFGVVQIFGGGFSILPMDRLRPRAGRASPLSILVLGMVSGLTGFCTGPILGAVLTVAAASGQALRGGVLLAVYAAGMAAPLFVLAVLWDRYGLARRRWLRGRAVRLGRLHVHTTSMVSGVIFIGLGVLFVTSGGAELSVLPTAPAGWSDRLSEFARAAQRYVPDVALIAVVAAVVGVLAIRRLRRAAPAPAESAEDAREQEDAGASRRGERSGRPKDEAGRAPGAGGERATGSEGRSPAG